MVDFIDKRRGTFTYGDRKVTVDPDEVGDFTNFNDTSVCLCEYNLVVFDPPHLTRAGEGSYLREKYGVLPHDWEKELSRGFSECFRTLCDGGVLAFKWSDYDIPFKKVFELAPYRPAAAAFFVADHPEVKEIPLESPANKCTYLFLNYMNATVAKVLGISFEKHMDAAACYKELL